MKFAAPVIVTLAAIALTAPSADAFGCEPAKIKSWISACESVTGGSKAKCDNKLCHVALHRLVEDETIECYVSSGLGAAGDLAKYKKLDDFCHGDGPDPELTPSPAPTTTAPPSTTKPPATTTPAPTSNKPTDTPAPTSSSSPSVTPAPSSKPSPKPSC